MANLEYAKILGRGVGAWNDWREKHPIRVPDLSAIDLHDHLPPSHKWLLHKEGVNLANVDFHGAKLIKTNFYAGFNNGADLTGANLREAKLNGAFLGEADLEGADLWKADLSDASLWDANLANANLAFSTLTQTDLTGVDLTGADLTGSEPWKAILYDSLSEYAQNSPSLPDKKVKTIESLLSEFQNLQCRHKDATFYFRGESKLEWPLTPSVMRDEFAAENESRMLLDLNLRLPEAFSRMTHAMEQWVLAQHHGLKTRFLDITRNPMVALFNACRENPKASGRLHIFAVPAGLIKPYNSDTASIIANFARLSHYEQYRLLGKTTSRNGLCFAPALGGYHNEIGKKYSRAMVRLYQFIREEKPHFAERIDPRTLYQAFVIEPPQSNERIRAQSGAFLASAFHERFERSYIHDAVVGVPVYYHYRLIIPNKSKLDFLSNLRLFNITRETMFPGLDSSAEAITDHYRQQYQQAQAHQD